MANQLENQRILRFIELHYEQYGTPPSIREIVDGLGLSSTSVAVYRLNQLKQSGELVALRKERSGARLFVPKWLHRKIKRLVRQHHADNPV